MVGRLVGLGGLARWLVFGGLVVGLGRLVCLVALGVSSPVAVGLGDSCSVVSLPVVSGRWSVVRGSVVAMDCFC